MRLTVLGKSPSWQDAGGACSGYLIEHGRHLRPDGLRQRRLLEAAALPRLPDGRRGRHLAPARRPLPRPGPVLVRAHLRTAPAAGAGRPLARHRRARAAAADRAARSARDLPQVVGAWGNDDLVENAFELDEYSPDGRPRGRAACASASTRSRISPRRSRSRSRPPTAAAASSSSAPTAGPPTSSSSSPATADLFLVEGTLPRPERSGQRGHLTPREAGEHGRAAAVKRIVITHISDELDALWARKEAAAGFGAEVEVAREGAVYSI